MMGPRISRGRVRSVSSCFMKMFMLGGGCIDTVSFVRLRYRYRFKRGGGAYHSAFLFPFFASSLFSLFLSTLPINIIFIFSLFSNSRVCFQAQERLAETSLTLRKRFAMMTVALCVGYDTYDHDDLDDSHDYLVSFFTCLGSFLRSHIRYTEYPGSSFWFWAFAWQIIIPVSFHGTLLGLSCLLSHKINFQVAKCSSCLVSMAGEFSVSGGYYWGC